MVSGRILGNRKGESKRKDQSLSSGTPAQGTRSPVAKPPRAPQHTMEKALARPEWPRESHRPSHAGTGERPRRGALRRDAVNPRSPPPFIHTGPFGVNNSALAPRPVLIDCTRSSAEAAWACPGGRTAPFSTAASPSSLGCPRCAKKRTGWGGGGRGARPRPLSSLALLCCCNFFIFHLLCQEK